MWQVEGLHWSTRVRRLCRLALACLLSAGVARAGTPELELECARLSDAERDELSARGRLTLASAGLAAPKRVVLHCDERSAWLEWRAPDSERVEVDQRQGLVEGVLSAIDARLARRPRAADRRVAERAAPAPVSVPAPAAERRANGGLGLGVSWQPWSDPRLGGVGPRLDLAVRAGPLLLVATEVARFGLSRSSDGASVVQFASDVGALWGAPFDAASGIGLRAALGEEWLLAATRTDQTAASPSAALEVLGAVRAGAFAPWFGVEGRARLHALSFAAPVEASVPALTLSVSLGVLWLADAERPR